MSVGTGKHNLKKHSHNSFQTNQLQPARLNGFIFPAIPAFTAENVPKSPPGQGYVQQPLSARDVQIKGATSIRPYVLNTLAVEVLACLWGTCHCFSFFKNAI